MAAFACGLSFLAAAFMAPAASADTVGVDLRVVSDTGKAFTDIRQYTDTTTVPTSPKAACFGLGSDGSGNAITINGPTAVGALSDAARSTNALDPFLITDKYVGSFGVGVCSMAGVGFEQSTNSFWQLRVDHKATEKGGDQVPVDDGDDVLWAFVPLPTCDFNPPYTCQPGKPELSISAPARTKPGVPFRVAVTEYNDQGFRKPAVGATVTGAAAPTDGAGFATVALAATGSITASRANTIPSRTISVCVSKKLKKCSTSRGLPIFGSDLPDSIRGTPGPDSIKSAGGDDSIFVRGGFRDSVVCGAGTDSVRADRDDKVDRASCEKVKRFGKKKRKHRKHGKHKGGKKK